MTANNSLLTEQRAPGGIRGIKRGYELAFVVSSKIHRIELGIAAALLA